MNNFSFLTNRCRLNMGPFAGSGITAVSAKNNGRNFICIDNSEEYCQMAKTRLEGGEWN